MAAWLVLTQFGEGSSPSSPTNEVFQGLALTRRSTISTGLLVAKISLS